MFAVVDEEDFERVNQFKWHVHKRHNNIYASCCIIINEIKTTLLMHRFILNNVSMDIDHVNGNGLYNYKSNLRPCTDSQNQFNSRKRNGCLSNYKVLAL